MDYIAITRCRICGNRDLRRFLSLGEQALTGVFPKSPEEKVTRGPLDLVKCTEEGPASGCGLVQLAHSYDTSAMYGANYGYRSGLNASMVRHLNRRVRHALELGRPRAGDVILDIGSNDGTTLSQYPTDLGLTLIGMDPTSAKFARYYPAHVRAVPDFFSAASFEAATKGAKARIVTSFAMFYDLEDPTGFMREVNQVLHDDGVWIFEQSYLPAMLAETAYDTICHEHLSYYALRQILHMTRAVGLHVIDVEVNDVNGGSFCVAVSRRPPDVAGAARVAALIAQEASLGLGRMAIFDAFTRRVFSHRDALKDLVAKERAAGRTTYGYGASTKGNVILQFCGFGPQDFPAIAEVNEEKFGAFTPGTLIPITSEREVRARRPDNLLVLPWHFRKGIVEREAAFLAGGGKLLFPLPRLELVGASTASAGSGRA